MTAIGIGGEKEMAVIETVVQISVQSDKCEVGAVEITGMVDDLTALTAQMKRMHGIDWDLSMLLGGDTLSKLSARIDYQMKTVTLCIKARSK